MVTHLFMQNKNLKQIYFWPIMIGLMIAVGLVTALVKDGFIERISLIGLVIPIAVIMYFYWIKHD